MYTITKNGTTRFSRPYPFDFERKQKIEKIMFERGIKTISALAKEIKMNQGLLSCIINGTRLSPYTEERIARFFKMKRDELFIIRTAAELRAMFDAEKNGKKLKDKGAA